MNDFLTVVKEKFHIVDEAKDQTAALRPQVVTVCGDDLRSREDRE